MHRYVTPFISNITPDAMVANSANVPFDFVNIAVVTPGNLVRILVRLAAARVAVAVSLLVPYCRRQLLQQSTRVL